LAKELFEKGNGMVLPIFGAFLGGGIAWSLLDMLRFHGKEWSDSQQLASFDLLGRISWQVFLKSWRIAAWVIVGALIAFHFAQPQAGVCDAKKAGCEDHLLMKMPFRFIGMAIIIYMGSIFLEFGLLTGVTSIRYGVDIPRSQEFLGPKRQRIESAGTDGAAAD